MEEQPVVVNQNYITQQIGLTVYDATWLVLFTLKLMSLTTLSWWWVVAPLFAPNVIRLIWKAARFVKIFVGKLYRVNHPVH